MSDQQIQGLLEAINQNLNAVVQNQASIFLELKQMKEEIEDKIDEKSI